LSGYAHFSPFFNLILQVSSQLLNRATFPPPPPRASVEWLGGGTTASLEGLEKRKTSYPCWEWKPEFMIAQPAA